MGDYGGVPVSIIRRESLQTESLRRGSDFSGSVPESVLRREWMLAGQRRGSDFSGSVPESIIRRESISLRPETELSPMYEGDRTSESTVTADTAYPQRFVHLVPEEAHGLLRKESYQKSQASPNADNASVIMQKNRQISPPELRQPNRFDRTALSTTTTTTPTSLVERIRHSALQTAQQIRSRIINSGWKCTPRLLAHFAVILILSALFFTIFGVLMKQTEVRYSLHEFILYPRLQTREGHPLNYVPSKLYMKFGTNQQAWFELRSNLPFKSSSTFVMDFRTSFIAIADHALTNTNGSQKYCFIMPLDKTAFPHIEALRDAFEHTREINETMLGWQQYWNVVPQEITAEDAIKMLSRSMDKCNDVKWYKLVTTSVPQNEVSRCYGCTDFCVPEFNLQRERSFDKSFYTLTVRRQNCFWLNVPEWRQWRDFDYQQGAMDGNNIALGSTGYWRQQPARSSWDGSFNNNRNQQYNPIYPNYQPNVAYPSYQQPQYVPPPGRR